ncbi:MAG: hypothetical protein HYX89_06575 [Chloroflexi bacterium]|nr:hypothetical protein [Chloroflexota bacterium]
MISWFTSLNGAITLSLVALLTFVGRTFVDYQYVYPEFFPSPGQALVSITINVALVGGWIWALLAVASGKRGGLIAVLLFALLLSVGFGVATLVAFCPSPCPTAWPLGEVANWINLIAGVVAAVAVGLQLRASSQMARG